MWFNFLAGVDVENYPDAIRVMQELAKRGEYSEGMLKSIHAMPFSGPANVIGRVKRAIMGGGVDDATISKFADAIQEMDLLHHGQHIEATGIPGKLRWPLKRILGGLVALDNEVSRIQIITGAGFDLNDLL